MGRLVRRAVVHRGHPTLVDVQVRVADQAHADDLRLHAGQRRAGGQHGARQPVLPRGLERLARIAEVEADAEAALRRDGRDQRFQLGADVVLRAARRPAAGAHQLAGPRQAVVEIAHLHDAQVDGFRACQRVRRTLAQLRAVALNRDEQSPHPADGVLLVGHFDGMDGLAVALDPHRPVGGAQAGAPDLVRPFHDEDSVGRHFATVELLDERARALLLPHGRLMPDHARQPQVAAQLDSGLLQRGGGVDHRHETALHILRAAAVNPLVVTRGRHAIADGDGVRMAVQSQGRAVALTQEARQHVVAPRRGLVESDGEAFAVQQFRQELRAGLLLARRALDPDELQAIRGQGFAVDVGGDFGDCRGHEKLPEDEAATLPLICPQEFNSPIWSALLGQLRGRRDVLPALAAQRLQELHQALLLLLR